MAENSKIEWCDDTGNIWWGCEHAGAGCLNCYAEAWSARFDKETGPLWGTGSPRRLIKGAFDKFRAWDRKARQEGRKRLVFVGSMMDIFEPARPLIHKNGEPVMIEDERDAKEGPFYRRMTTSDARSAFFNEIVPQCTNLIFLLLTKRSSLIKKTLPLSWSTRDGFPSNVMLGATVANSRDAWTVNRNIYYAAQEVPLPNFLSVEPMLEPIALPTWYTPNWVICGGESGPKRRPFKIEWAEDLYAQCKERGIPFFMKQIDKVRPIPEHLMVREFPTWFNRGTNG